MAKTKKEKAALVRALGAASDAADLRPANTAAPEPRLRKALADLGLSPKETDEVVGAWQEEGE